MQTANIIPYATQTRTIVEIIRDVNLEFVNLQELETAVGDELNVTLGKCHDLCKRITNTDDSTDRREFDSYYEKLKLKNTKKLSLVSKVLNCTFADINVSKRSAYKAVIEFAIAENVPIGGFVEFVTQTHSGIQQARLAKYRVAQAKSNTPTYETRLQQTQNYFALEQLASVPDLVLEGVVPTQQIGEQFVLIATRTAGGHVVFNLATAEQKAVNAVLNIMYKPNKQRIEAMPKTSLQTSFTPTATASVPPDSFAASSYSTDALSNGDAVTNALLKIQQQVAEEECI